MSEWTENKRTEQGAERRVGNNRRKNKIESRKENRKWQEGQKRKS